MSYLVMECHPGYAILLDEEGRFLKAANLRYEIGQTVYDPVLMKKAPEKQWNIVRRISSGIAAIAACFLFVFGISYYQNYIQLYSSIYLTINPEVQMDLNRRGMVVRLTGTNEDGKTLLEGYDGKGKDKVTVADELIDRAIEMDFLSEGGRVSFSIDSPDDALFQEYGMELRTEVTEHLAGRITITIEIINYKDGRGQESLESSSSPVPSQPASASPASSQTESAPPSVSESSRPEIAPSEPFGATDYDDTDYGSDNDGITDYMPPASTAPAVSSAAPASTEPAGTVPADTDYGPGNDGDTDYMPPASTAPAVSSAAPASTEPASIAPADTDYGPGNSGDSGYTDGNTDYDRGSVTDDGFDDDGDSGYSGNDGSDDDSDYDNDPDDDD